MIANLIPSPLFKVILPLAGLIAALLISKLKGRTASDIWLITPELRYMIYWIIVWLTFIFLTDYLFDWRGKFDADLWAAQPLWVSVCRVLGVGLLGPVLEEIVFRGFIFRAANKYIRNEWISMVLVALVWASIHSEYDLPIKGLIFANGLILGASLIRSRSLYIPIALHIIWNMYAVW